MPLRGWIVRPLGSPNPERRLLLAIIVQGVKDAQRGQTEAVTWLVEVGPAYCKLLGLDPDLLQGWPAVSWPAVGAKRTAHKAPRETPAERSRRYRETRKARAQATEA